MNRFLHGLWLSPRTFRATAVIWFLAYVGLVLIGLFDPTTTSRSRPYIIALVLAFFTLGAAVYTLGLMRMSGWSVAASLLTSGWLVFLALTDPDVARGDTEGMVTTVRAVLVMILGLPGLLTLIGAARHWRELTWNPLGKTLAPPAAEADIFA